MREEKYEEDPSKRCHDTVEGESGKIENKNHWENSKEKKSSSGEAMSKFRNDENTFEFFKYF